MDIRERIEQICVDFGGDDRQKSQQGSKDLIDLLRNHPNAVMDALRIVSPKEKSAVMLMMAYMLRKGTLHCPERRQFFFEAFLEERDDERSRYHFLGTLIMLLEKDPDETIAAALTPYFYDEMPRVRSLMCSFARHTKARKAVPYLVSLLDDVEREVVYHAYTALTELDFPEAKEALHEWEDRNGKPDFTGLFK